MKNLVRGAAILSILSLFTVFMYAQGRTKSTPVIANDSQIKIDNTFTDIHSNALVNNKADNKKLVRTTGSVRAAGASRGTFSATAYCLQGKTAMGHGVRRGLIAADPRVLRLGSRITVNGAGYSGSYLVSDTGGKIKGNRLDIWMPSCSEARKFGRRTVQVYNN
jgi:3D (Asp-Asp-Asp) domain-containing protein